MDRENKNNEDEDEKSLKKKSENEAVNKSDLSIEINQDTNNTSATGASSIELMRNSRDSFEESIRPSSPSQVSSLENVESMCNEQGERIKIIRTVKEIYGSCPKIGAKEAFGTQVRERTEKKGQGVESFTDFKTESIISNDGTKITRTSQASRIKYSYGSRRPEMKSIISSSALGTSGEIIDTKRDREEENKNNNFLFTFEKEKNINTSLYKTNVHQSEFNEKKDIHQMFSNNQTKIYSSQIKDETSSSITQEIIAPTFSYELENYTIKKGETAFFKGTVNGTYPFEVTWYLDNQELKPSHRVEMTIKQDYTETFLTGLIDYIVSLKILNCSYKDIGKYTVFVKNKAGDASCSAFLIIEGKIMIKN